MSSKNKKKPSTLKKIMNSKAMKLLTIYELADIIGPASSMLGMETGGQIKKKRKSFRKKPRGWGKARYGK